MKNKVVEIYFEDNNAMPSFLLENGKVKRPGILNGSSVWGTEEEWDEVKKNLKENPWWKFWKF